MLRRTLTAVAVILAMGAAFPAAAQRSQGDAVVSYHALMKMADKNNDGMVTKQEFMNAMSEIFDKHMTAMKASKPAAVKGGMLDAAAIRELFMMLYPGN